MVDGDPIRINLTVGPDGALRSAWGERWGDQTDDHRFALIPFGARVLEERTLGGSTLPSRVEGGWWYGTERYVETLHLVLQEATFA